MRVTSTFQCVAERNLRWLTPSLPHAAEYCTAVAPALADVSAFDARLVVGLTRPALARLPASLAVLP
jgi:hypothetical protein